jgi:hypothetical protein
MRVPDYGLQDESYHSRQHNRMNSLPQNQVSLDKRNTAQGSFGLARAAVPAFLSQAVPPMVRPSMRSVG